MQTFSSCCHHQLLITVCMSCRCTGLMVNPAWCIICVITLIAGTVVFMLPDEQTALSCPSLGLHLIDITPESDQTCSLSGFRFTFYCCCGSVLYTGSIVCFAALHVDTGRLLPLAQQVPRKQRRWFPCKFGSVDVENHLVFVCSAYCALRGTFIAISWAQAPTLSFFSRLHDLKTIARFLKQFLEHRHTVVAYCLI